jgi:hypothetical protein
MARGLFAQIHQKPGNARRPAAPPPRLLRRWFNNQHAVHTHPR